MRPLRVGNDPNREKWSLHAGRYSGGEGALHILRIRAVDAAQSFDLVQLTMVLIRGADVALHHLPTPVRNRQRGPHQLRITGKTREVGESPIIETQLVSEGGPLPRVDAG